MNAIRNFFRIVTIHTAIVIALSCVATFGCLYFDIIVDLPTGIIGIAIVFPIVFSINAAYRRREEALRYFGSLKGHAVALFYAHRDWVPEENQDHPDRMRNLMESLLHAIKGCFLASADDNVCFEGVYGKFSQISGSIEQLRDAGVSGTEISRCNQYLKQMMIEFERMRNIHVYRTPTALRAYSQIFLNAFPVLFAPYFATISDEYSLVSGYLVAVLYSLILVSLDNIQEDLEDPFDQIGEDDLNLDVAEHYKNVLVR